VGKWRRWIRSGIIRGSRVWWIGALYRKACQLITWMVGHRLASIAGVEATYTRHSHPRFVTFAPGQSDLDLTLVLDDDAARNAAVVRTCADQVDALSGTFGFIFPQDARFVTRRELAQIEARPGAAEILSGPGTWIRIGGRELRQDRQLPIVASYHIVRHPEFNAWWLNVMQTPMLTPQTRLPEDELRLCFRVAMKNQLNLLVARGRMAPPTDPYLPDSSAASLFADDPEMTRMLGNLERTHFRTPDWKERKAGIFHRSLTLAADFYRDLPVPSDAVWIAPAAGPSPALAEAHRDELRDRFGRARALKSIAESIIIYPTPHWAPGEYQIDLILRDDVTSAAIDEAVMAIKSFGGRTFGIGGTHAQVTMIPRIAFEHPWYFLGTPFPFLHRHVATSAEVLFGAPPKIPGAPGRDELLRWCTTYYFFHRFTSRYRPRYVSKDCNFCQIAAIRLFLEHGTMLTDVAEVQRAYLGSYAPGEEQSHALNYLLRREADLSDAASFADALRIQAREYDAVERLLREAGMLSSDEIRG
jgi:hypothetical protein